jgi:hypothetical protein
MLEGTRGWSNQIPACSCGVHDSLRQGGRRTFDWINGSACRLLVADDSLAQSLCERSNPFSLTENAILFRVWWYQQQSLQHPITKPAGS